MSNHEEKKWAGGHLEIKASTKTLSLSLEKENAETLSCSACAIFADLQLITQDDEMPD